MGGCVDQVTQLPARPVVALIAAAGKGSRLGADLPKAYVALRGKTLIERSVRAMIYSGVVDEVIVIISPAMEAHARAILERAGLLHAEIPVRLVFGGGERADSVWEGIQAIAYPEAVVLVHDAARALTPPGMIARVARAVLQGYKAVIPVLPVTDTIKVVEGDTVERTLDRESLRAVQTPQGLDLQTARAANAAYFSGPPHFQATDDASLMEWFGVPISCVAGDPMAFKITTPIDYMLAKAVTDEAEPTIFEVPDD
ncbi:2-C-methyl-D-erythritol 4-phosphate cytidylyltransferase [Corynebacterium sp. ES2775-CONJ]|uniref:2-C-methyl-D-erythritol 4-phosphate cytidylyltransferase n=1 Tax=Corynebacterium sp. ES2775-CONJ TaxID=2974029 RepID=UPI002167555A|nr:2-C-methyl-D-erythritol 4-phosphate cytidylyltransferase [Corynebacterium sp. ES2775-CONJ]MCS4490269.1 2-C-methyl-D-erythritol 4-phosphate cytidylyltransferase [Corynebacterium sp. ES2775-CONJ]